MLSPEPLIVGSVCDVLRRCGNPACHCAKAPAHRQTLLLYGEGGRRTSKFIRQRDVQWVRRAWRRYRRFKEALRELRALHSSELRFLRERIRLRAAVFPVEDNSGKPRTQ
jgi:hypothetical protein